MPSQSEDRSLIASLSRRWYFAVLAVLGLAAAGWFLGQQVGVSYRTSGSFGIVGPPVEIQPEPGTGESIIIPVNPIGGGNSYGNFAQVIGAVVDSQAVRNQLGDQGLSEDYTVLVDRGAGIVSFDVAAETPAIAQATANQIMDTAERAVNERQELIEVEEILLAQFAAISVPSSAEEDQARRIQSSLGLAAIGVALGLALTAILDAMLLGRRERKLAKLSAVAETDPLDESWAESSLWDEAAFVDDGFDQAVGKDLMGDEPAATEVASRSGSSADRT